MIQITIDNDIFFTLIGRIITSEKIYKLFGEPVITNEKQQWFIEHNGNSVSGFCCYEAGNKKSTIKYIYVEETKRSCGIGSFLIQAAIKQAQIDGCEIIETVTNNIENSIFIKCGFKVKKEYAKWAKMEMNIKNRNEQ